MQVINKKIIVIFICLSIFIFGLYKLFNKEQIVLDNVILDINNSKDSLAIYIEEYDEEGNASYVESEENTFPLDNNYVYNKELSGCLDNNSNEVENALKYDYVKKELNLRVNKPVTCYVYYDYKGNGTETVPYKIRSIEDLLDLSLSTNNGNKHTNEYFELTRDLDFSDINSYNDSKRTDYGNLNGITNDGNTLMEELTSGTGWVPIGNTTANKFEGFFNGNNKQIKNIYINNNKEGNRIGLFGSVLNSAIKNLTLDGNIKTVIKANMGSFIGDAHNTTLDNCVSKVNITSEAGDWSSGGLIGATFVYNEIKNSHNEGNVTGGAWIGGLVGGYSDGTLTIEDSYNTGTISKVDDVAIQGIGGLVGAAATANNNWHINITNSYNTGEVSDTSQTGRVTYAGGLVGRSVVELNISGSYNSGKVVINGTDRTTNSGGLIGVINGKTYISNSYNVGYLETNIGQSTHQLSTGGLAGRSYSSLIITGFKNLGNITGGNRIGGIVGMLQDSNSKTIIDKSYNVGTISPSFEEYWNSNILIGGLIGLIYNGASMYLVNSYNEGNLKCSSNKQAGYCGGLIKETYGNLGLEQLGVILNSYNIGNLSNSNLGSGTGSLAGGTLKINNVYNMGDFKDVITKYGIGDFNNQNYNITKAYYRNKAEDGSDISGSNITSNEIIGKDLSYMQSNDFINELNNNISNIKLSDYIDSTLLEEFKNKTGYELTLSKWKLKDNHPILVALEGM